MRLRSGLILGESEANRVVEVSTAIAMQEDNSSTRAERGTPHPSSFSTNDAGQSPKSPALGEAGPSNYQEHQPVSEMSQLNEEVDFQQDFYLYDTPEPGPIERERRDFSQRRVLRPILPRPSAMIQNAHTTTQGQRAPLVSSWSSRFPHAPTLQTSTQNLYQTSQIGIASGSGEGDMISTWNQGPRPWSPTEQTLAENRLRSLLAENPTQDLTGYPLDRNFKDKMEEDLDSLGLTGVKGTDEGNTEQAKNRDGKGREKGKGVTGAPAAPVVASSEDEQTEKKKKLRRSNRKRGRSSSHSGARSAGKRDHDRDPDGDGHRQAAGQRTRIC